ncbi:MAG TPA: RdgB/HAM1 family non-canonical purine NTP pyrophosphatase [Pyrinomonadaceae bacterium]|nr:RdgB/HAM1 family non-canonical purine NTP pyrophosphatase [Pyrinomonadaceae bacterium]
MSQGELLIATSNDGKLREAREILKDLGFRLLTLSDWETIEAVPETGVTFIENASLKATAYARQTRMLTLADDSGLEIDALHGAPGVRSARFLGPDASYEVRNQSLLDQLRSHQNRAARFVCAIAIADANGKLLNVSTGTCEGQIATAARGSGGFGYDPIFIPDAFDMTFGELSGEIKNQISHRGRALKSAREFLSGLTGSSSGS